MIQPTHQHPYRRAKVIIFDIDNMLYNQTRDMLAEAGVAFLGAVKSELGGTNNLTDMQIIQAGMAALREHGDAYTPEGCQNQNPRTIHAKMHTAWQATTIQPNATLASMLGELKAQGIQLYAYSDAHQDWSRRVLNQLGVSDIFPDENLITRDKLKTFCTKHTGIEGFEYIKEHSGAAYNEMVLADDSPRNLKNAKALGITPALNQRGEKGDGADITDHHYSSALDFIRDFNQQRLPMASAIRALATRTCPTRT
jgi:FMN phosphatase YigB (HAD superfamily)